MQDRDEWFDQNFQAGENIRKVCWENEQAKSINVLEREYLWCVSRKCCDIIEPCQDDRKECGDGGKIKLVLH